MFERFDDNARQVVHNAQAVARRLHHDYVGTEHLIIALAKSDKSVSQAALLGQQYTSEALLEQIKVGHAEPPRDLPFTPRAKKVLEQSLRQAIARKSMSITDADLLLGILHPKDDNAAVEMLKKIGGPNAVASLREAVFRHLDSTGTTVPEDGDDLIKRINDSLAALTADELREVLCLVELPQSERQERMKPSH